MSVKLRAEIWASQIQGNHNEAISKQNPFNKDFDRKLFEGFQISIVQTLWTPESMFDIDHIISTIYYDIIIWPILYGPYKHIMRYIRL